MFTPAQLENQRLFRVGPFAEPEQPGDKGKRVARKLAIFTGATAADLAESWGAEKIIDHLESRMVDFDLIKRNDPKAITKNAYFGGIAFIEDAMSDELYVLGMNALLRGWTGLEEANYVSPTAKFISGWTNLGSWASGKFGGKEKKFYQKPFNFVNAVNVEAAIGLLEEVPFLGKGVAKAHAWANSKISSSEAFQLANAAVTVAVAGYNIEKNIVTPRVVKAATPAPAAPQAV